MTENWIEMGKSEHVWAWELENDARKEVRSIIFLTIFKASTLTKWEKKKSETWEKF